ncbi:ARID DNA-binding domain-containing protein [Tanacetum coccineum]
MFVLCLHPGVMELMWLFSSSTGLFSFQFSSMDRLDAMLENGPWFIQNNPLILKKWHPDENLLKEDVSTVPVWVKIHGVLVTAFHEDGLSAIATKLGAGEKQTVKKPSQTSRGVSVGPKMGFKSHKEYRPVPKKPTASSSGNKKKGVEPTIKVSNSNLFDILNSVDNDVVFGTNEGTTNLVNNEATSSFGTQSLLEQWRDSYGNGDYDADPYDDDMYEGQDLSHEIQAICNNLDIRDDDDDFDGGKVEALPKRKRSGKDGSDYDHDDGRNALLRPV